MENELNILRKEIFERIEQLKSDKQIDSSKKSILIKENTKFLVRVQQLGLPYLKNNNYQSIAQNGQEQTYAIANAKRVTQFMLELLFDSSLSNNYEWSEYKFKNGSQI